MNAQSFSLHICEMRGRWYGYALCGRKPALELRHQRQKRFRIMKGHEAGLPVPKARLRSALTMMVGPSILAKSLPQIFGPAAYGLEVE